MEKATEVEVLSKKDSVPSNLLLRSNLVQQELYCMNINSLSLLDKMVQVTSDAVKNERYCRTLVQQLVFSIPRSF